jgi:hypothetical protein
MKSCFDTAKPHATWLTRQTSLTREWCERFSRFSYESVAPSGGEGILNLPRFSDTLLCVNGITSFGAAATRWFFINSSAAAIVTSPSSLRANEEINFSVAFKRNPSRLYSVRLIIPIHRVTSQVKLAAPFTVGKSYAKSDWP